MHNNVFQAVMPNVGKRDVATEKKSAVQLRDQDSIPSLACLVAADQDSVLKGQLDFLEQRVDGGGVNHCGR